jgi:hypothetical protein
MRWSGHVALVEEIRGACVVVVGKPQGKRRLERPRCRWEDNIKWILNRSVGWAWTALSSLRIGTSDVLL